MWINFNENPNGIKTGDCVIRAISTALDQDWEKTYIDLCLIGQKMGDWGNSNPVWDYYLKEKGFSRSVIPNNCPLCYTISDFAYEHPQGTYLVATGSHVVAVIDGNYIDNYDSGELPIVYYYERGVK